MINYLIFSISYAFACVVQPGPFQAFLFSQSLTHGWRKTLLLVFAPLISDLPIVLLVLVVLTNVSHVVLQILQCLGGVFLLWLAFKAYKTWQTFKQSDKKDVSQRRNLFRAVIVNLLNPAPYLGWSLVMGPQLIKGWSENPINGFILLIGFYGTMVIGSAFMVMVFAAAGSFGPRIHRISLGFSVIALVIFGVYQLLSGLTAFL